VDRGRASKRVGEVAELRVLSERLQVGLLEEPRLGPVGAERPRQDGRAIPCDHLTNDPRWLRLGTFELELVAPVVAHGIEVHRDQHFAVSPSVQAPKVGEITSQLQCVRQAAAGHGDVAQEAKRVQKVRLPTCIGTDDEQSLLQRRIDASEVSPVGEAEVLEGSAHACFSFRYAGSCLGLILPFGATAAFWFCARASITVGRLSRTDEPNALAAFADTTKGTRSSRDIPLRTNRSGCSVRRAAPRAPRNSPRRSAQRL
jgi:hypothetical protein